MHKPVVDMSDNVFIAHMELHHEKDLPIQWPEALPLRRLASRGVWLAYHDHFLHKAPRRAGHEHTLYLWTGWERKDMSNKGWVQRTPCNCLHPPTHQPDCTGRLGLTLVGDTYGPSAQDKLWEKLDGLMDGLISLGKNDMKYAAVPQAEALAYATALALILNPSDPDVNIIRKEAVRRWKERNNAE